MNSTFSKSARDFANTLKKVSAQATSPYDTQAEVMRVEGDTAWVHIPGGIDETPVQLTTNAKKGDVVQVRVSGGRAWITGNATSPPTDDTMAIYAKETATGAELIAKEAIDDAERAHIAADAAEVEAVRAHEAADDAYASAVSAQTSADSALVSLSTVEDVVGVLNWITAHGEMVPTSDVAINPAHVYFVVDPTGDYVVGGTHYSIIAEPKVEDISTYYELSVNESVQNYVATHVVVDTEGLWLVPDSGGNKVLIATGAGSVYTTAGTYIIGKVNGLDTVFAKFAQNGIQIGQPSKSHLEVTNQSMKLIDIWNDEFFSINDYRTGAYSVVQTFTGDGTTTDFPLIVKAISTNDIAVYVNNAAVTTGITKSVYSVLFSSAPANGSVIRIEYNSQYASGAKAYTFGKRVNNSFVGEYSIVAGVNNIASGDRSFAEGSQTKASGLDSHTEGALTEALNLYAHAEGWSSVASGQMAHAQNYYTIASGSYQTALGKFNVADNNNAVIIGNGTAHDARSNALTVDWSGNVNIASGAKYKINGTALSASDISNAVSTSNVTTSGESGKIPQIKSDGVLELRKYIDLHDTSSTTDYDVRVTCGSTTGTDGGASLNFTCGSFRINSNTVTDFVIEQGMLGIWYYRKWKSGKIEGWCNDRELTSVTPSTWSNPVRYADTTCSIVNNLFTSAPMVTVTSTDNQWGVFSAYATSEKNINIRFITCATAASTPNINIYAIQF